MEESHEEFLWTSPGKFLKKYLKQFFKIKAFLEESVDDFLIESMEEFLRKTMEVMNFLMESFMVEIL